jgi:hypothetical protein
LIPGEDLDRVIGLPQPHGFRPQVRRRHPARKDEEEESG